VTLVAAADLNVDAVILPILCKDHVLFDDWLLVMGSKDKD